MKVTVEDQSSVKKVLHIEVPQEDVTREVDSAYAELKKTAKIKGFRPGKTPRSVLERMYKKDVNADVSQKLIQDALVEAITETKLKLVGMPQVDPPELKNGSAYAFDAACEVQPEISDIDYKGLNLKKTLYQASDSEIDVQLQRLRQNMAQRNVIEEERPVREGDLAVVDYEGYQDGKPHEETQKTENFAIKVGDGHVIKDLDDGLVGMTVGEEKTIDAVFPEDYGNEALAGQKIEFRVKLNEIREEILPELNDEFARGLSDEFGTLDVLKTKIRENVQSGYDKRMEQELHEQIYQQLLEKTEFEVPDAMVDAELEQIIREAEQSFQYNNKTFEDVGLTREKLAENYRPTAEKQVRRHLILSKLIDQETLELSDEELDKGFQEMADTYRQPVDQIKAYYNQNQDGLTFFKHTLLEKKALDIIIDNSVIEEGEPESATESESAS